MRPGIPNGPHGKLVRGRRPPVRQRRPGPARAHLVGEVDAPSHDRVGSELPHQLLVGGRGIGDDAETLGLAQLHNVTPDGAGGAGHGQGAARAPSASTSRASRAVRPFMGSVAASASVAPAGLRTTDSAGTTTRSA